MHDLMECVKQKESWDQMANGCFTPKTYNAIKILPTGSQDLSTAAT